MKKAIFFDRDGTLIEDAHYLSSLDQIVLIPKMIAFARECQQLGYILVVVTNQSGIARGYFDEAFVERTHQHLAMLLRNEGVSIAGWYMCPHHPIAAVQEQYKQDCSCRKPQPGMLVQAAKELHIDCTQSYMIGDKDSDLEAGKNAGCFYLSVQDIMKSADSAQEILARAMLATRPEKQEHVVAVHNG